jgi:hypothetical protein
MPRKKRITKKVLFIKTIEMMQPILRLSDWKIIVKFSYSKKMKNTAYCEALPEYKVAEITMNHNDLSGLTHNEIVCVAIHEMMHCILWELGTWTFKLSGQNKFKMEVSRKYEEAAVTSLEKILLPLVTDKLNNLLKSQGYQDIDLTFTDFMVEHNKE